MRRLVLVLAISTPALAQVGSPNVLTPAQISAFEQLVSAAKKADPAYLQALATEAQKRADLSPWNALSATVSGGVGYGRGSSNTNGSGSSKNVNDGILTNNSSTTLNRSGFDQVDASAHLTVSLDLVKLFSGSSPANTQQLAALTASSSAAGRDLRVRVLQAFTAYLSAMRSAGVAADALEVATAALGQAQVRATAGAATGVDVLKAGQARGAADAALYDANLKLAVSKQQLSAVTGLELPDLDTILKGAKPTP